MEHFANGAVLPPYQRQALPLPLPRAHRQRTLAEANCTDTGRTWPVPIDNRDFFPTAADPCDARARPAAGAELLGLRSKHRPLSGTSRPLPPSGTAGRKGGQGYRRHPARPPRITRARAGRCSRSAPHTPRSVTRPRPRRARGDSRRGAPGGTCLSRSRPCPRSPRVRCPSEAGGLAWVERRRLPSG